MEFSGADQIHPEWGLYDQHLAQRWLPIMQNDANSFSHPLSMNTTHGDLLIGAFDTVAYAKGSSVVRMMRNFMTEQTFNRGVTRYLARHLYSTVKPTDLWKAFDEQMIEDNIVLSNNTTLEDIMATWIHQMGYPCLQVTRDYQTNTVLVTQDQFLFDSQAQTPKSPYDYRWYIPLKFRSLSSSSSNTTWFNQRQINLTTSEHLQPNEWLLANPNLFGFFRTNYDARNWQLIIKQLRNGHENFTIAERIGLVDDVFNLARTSECWIRIKA